MADMANPHSTPVTRWTLIHRAQGSGPEARVALNELVRRYERTIRGHIQRWGCPPGVRPDDVQQDYLLGFCRRDDKRDDIGRLHQQHGKFRNFLAKSVKNHMRNAWNAWKAPGRGNLVTVHPVWLDVI